MIVVETCELCGRMVGPKHPETCVGPGPLTLQIARKIAEHGAFTDADAVLVARAYLDFTGKDAA